MIFTLLTFKYLSLMPRFRAYVTGWSVKQLKRICVEVLSQKPYLRSLTESSHEKARHCGPCSEVNTIVQMYHGRQIEWHSTALVFIAKCNMRKQQHLQGFQGLSVLKCLLVFIFGDNIPWQSSRQHIHLVHLQLYLKVFFKVYICEPCSELDSHDILI